MKLKYIIILCLFILINSLNGFAQWEKPIYTLSPNKMLGGGDTLIAVNIGSFGSINVSFDKGKTWDKIDNEIRGKIINDVIKIGNTLIVSTNAGMYTNTDFKKTWYLLNTGFSGQFEKITYAESALFAVAKINNNTMAPIFKSTDLGKTWVNFGPKGASRGIVFGLSKKIMIYCTESETYISKDGGVNWNIEYKMNRVSSVSIQNNNILIGQPNTSSYASINDGESFFQTPYTIYKTLISGIHWIGVGLQNVYYSSDKGKTWRDISAGLPTDTYFDSYDITAIGERLYWGNFVRNLSELDPNFLVGPTNTQTTIYRDMVALKWSDNSNNETGFVIERSEDNGKSFSEISRIGKDIKTYEDTTVRQRNFYSYRVAAIMNTSKSKFSNTAVAKVTATSCVDLPSLVSYYAKTVLFKAPKQPILFSSGSYLTSLDGGKTISSKPEIINKIFPYGVLDIEFPSEKVGYVLTNNYRGSYLKTTDGGDTWALNPAPKSPETINSNPLGILFASNDTGFVFYEYHYFKTINGGKDWKFMYKPESTSNQMQFLTSQIGFFFGTKGIYKTINGGVDWQLINAENSYNLLYYYFVNESIGFRINLNNLERTKNGGKTFEKLPFSGINDAKIHFQNEKIGFIISFNNIYKTTDSGLNWLKITPNEFMTNNLTGVSSNGNDVIVVGGSMIIVSHDLGETWEVKNKPNSGQTRISAIDENLMLFYSDSYLNEYSITKNGGKSVETNTFPIAFRTTLMILANDQEIVAFAKKTNELFYSDKPVYIFRSKDLGKTWNEPQLLTSKFGTPKDLVYRKDKLLLIDGGPIIKSSDNGNTWHVEENLSLNKGFTSYYLSEKNYFFSRDATLYRSVDGGLKVDSIATFDTKEQVNSKHISKICFINDLVGFVIGQGYLTKTTDGGKSWKYQNNPFDNRPYYAEGMYFINENKGYIVNGGGIMQTNNSGETWHQLSFLSSLTSTNSIQKIGNSLYFLDYFNSERGQFYKLISGPPPSAQIITGPNYYCLNDKIVNYQTQDTQSTYKWQIPSEIDYKIFRNNLDIKWKQTGNYKIGLKIINDCGTSELFEQTIQIKPKFENPKITVEKDIYFTSSADSDNRWLMNGVPIENAIEKTYVAQKPGTYQVQVSNQCGIGVSGKVLVVITENEDNPKETFELFPNPTTEIVRIKFFENLTSKNIFLFNNLGQRVELKDIIINESEALIDFRNLPSSTYLLKIKTGSNVYTRKIILQK